MQSLPALPGPGSPLSPLAVHSDLVKRMNMDEKLNQLVLPFGAKFPADYQSFNKSGLGGTYPLSPLPGQTWIETRNAWQRNAVENTRLGIPTSFIAETLHSGYAGGTNFPMPCLQVILTSFILTSFILTFILTKFGTGQHVERPDGEPFSHHFRTFK